MVMPITEMYKKLLEEQSNPMLTAAIAQMRLRQHAIKTEQDTLLANNKIALEEKDISVKELVEKIKADVRRDQEYINKFDAIVKMLEASDTPKFNAVPWAVRTNKMNLIIEGARTKIFGEDETNIMHLVNGKLPTGIDNEVNEFPVLGSGRFWGTSKPTYLSYGILAVNFSLSGHTIQNIPLTSTITHVAALPVGIALDPACRFFYHAETCASTFPCFGYVHSGYSFGGYREDEQRLHYDKLFGPEDCSSGVAKITGCSAIPAQ